MLSCAYNASQSAYESARNKVSGIVQLGVSVAHLTACDEQLETLNILRSVGLLLGKR